MTAEVQILPCRFCGEPKRIDSWCGSEACAERVAKSQAELAALIFGDPVADLSSDADR